MALTSPTADSLASSRDTELSLRRRERRGGGGGGGGENRSRDWQRGEEKQHERKGVDRVKTKEEGRGEGGREVRGEERKKNVYKGTREERNKKERSEEMK